MIEEIKNIVESFGVNFYDTQSISENNHKIFRVFITSKDGITLEQCAEISRVLSPILDLRPPMAGNYFLEVSSPGIERKLKTLEHFQGSIGELVRISLFSTEKTDGEIIKVEDKKITIKESDGEEFIVDYDDISTAKTYYNWSKNIK